MRVDTASFVLRREEDAKRRDNVVGTYIRLVKEPDTESKQRAFDYRIARMKAGKDDSGVFRYRQADFDAIPGSPWVYWITPGLRKLFETLPKLKDLAEPRQGLATADNFRFLRFWWEVGTRNIGFECSSTAECEARREIWYPYMKGGSFQRWYGNQEYCINYGRNGFELKAWAAPLYGNSGWSRIIKSPDFYFRRGLTWTLISAKGFTARLSPGGYVFDVNGMSCFPEASLVEPMLAVLNSRASAALLYIINPTIAFQVGDVARLPVPVVSNKALGSFVERLIALARADSEESEITYDFISPPDWKAGIEGLTARGARMAKIEAEVDDEVYKLYGISPEDRATIEAELPSAQTGEDVQADEAKDSCDDAEKGEDDSAQLSREALAIRWISYAVGVVLGRFCPGEENALGCGRFSSDTASRLHALSDSDGIVMLDEGHSDDLAARALDALQITLGEADAAALVRTALGNGDDLAVLLRRYLERDFFKHHIKQYRKRPVYWLLQSPQKIFSAYLFHERMTRDTLFQLQREYVDAKTNLIEARMVEARKTRDSNEGRERKHHERDLDDLAEALDDLRELSRRIKTTLDRSYQPHIDDGVLLNMAPLWELIPSWQAEPKKAWQALERGDYDWSQTAMDYWPERVREKCRTNKSYAIAHGLDIAPEA